MPTVSRRAAAGIAGAALLLLLHLRFAAWGLSAAYTLDDLMNIGRSIQFPISEQLLDVVLFFRPSAVYRPLPELILRGLYEAFGADPFPLRLLTHVSIAANVWLAYRFFRLFAPVSTALAAAVPLAHHPGFQLFYVSGGFLFDLACFGFYFLAAHLYWTGRYLAFLGVFVLALNSKEMAVTLPAVLLLLELTRPGDWTPRRFAPIAVAALMSAAFLAGRVWGPGGIASIGGYQPEYTLSMLSTQSARLLREFYLLPGIGPILLVAVAAFVPCNRTVVVGLAIAGVGFLPVAFLDRGLEQSYLPAAGLALLAANLLAWTIGRWQPALAFVIVYGWLWWQSEQRRLNPVDALAEGRRIATILADLESLKLDLPAGSRVLFVADPYPESRHATNFLLILLTGHAEIKVDWSVEGATDAPGRYTAVLTARDGRTVRLR